VANLKEKPVRDLARMAKQHGVAGWHSMRKDQLIRALIRKAKSSRPSDGGFARPSIKSAAGEASAKATRVRSVEIVFGISRLSFSYGNPPSLSNCPKIFRMLGVVN
jgi:hypothetical protein